MKKILAVLLCLSMLLVCFAGCGSSETASAAASSTAAAAEEQASEAAPAAEPEEEAAPQSAAEAAPASAAEEAEASVVEEVPEIEVSYPLTEDDITLTYMNREYMLVTDMLEDADWNNQILLKAAQEITGVKIDYIAVAAPSMDEVYALSFASGDYSDIYYWGVKEYSSGADGAIEDDVFIRLNELIDEYAPYYKQAREASEDIMRDTISDEGNIVTFYVLNTEDVYSGMGYQTRQDLLDEAGLDVPVTYDDWYEMLTAYKNMGVETPLYGLGDMGGLLFGGYGIAWNWVDFFNDPFFAVDGEVQFSPYQDTFEEFVTMCNKWYSEGLVNQDFYSMHNLTDTQALEIDGTTAVWDCYANAADIFNTSTAIAGASSVSIPNPVINEGDQIHLGTASSIVGNDCGAVSTQCEYPELAVQWLDFWYGPQGSQLLNYGVEGTTFEYDADGNPQYTDLITNNPDGLSSEAVNALYLGYNFAGLFDPTIALTTYSDNQLDSLDIWTSNMDADWVYPSGAAMTAEEATEYNAIWSDISTYLATEVTSFVTGERDLSTYDEFMETLESMDADRCIELKQEALDRYYTKALN